MTTVTFSPASNNLKVAFNPATENMTLKTSQAATRLDSLTDVTTAITTNNSIIVYDTASDKYVQRSIAPITQLIVESVLGTTYGGTGLSSFTKDGVLYAKTTGALALATGVAGQVFQIAANGTPAFGVLDGGTL
jgi:hypothetical protein